MLTKIHLIFYKMVMWITGLQLVNFQLSFCQMLILPLFFYIIFNSLFGSIDVL